MHIAFVVFVRTGIVAGLAVLLVAVAPRSALAEPVNAAPDSDSAQVETAEASHRAAVVAFAKGRYREAIDLFLEANRLLPRPALSFNVARCYEQMNDEAQTLAWYRDYLRRAGAPSDAASVQRRIARLERRLASQGVQQVSILSTPAGADVLIDGTVVGVSPYTAELSPGAHSVELRRSGYRNAAQSFELAPEHALDVEVPMFVTDEPAPEPARPVVALNVTPLVEPQPRDVQRPARAPASGSALVPVGWVALGLGAAAFGGALAFELLRRDAEHDAQHEAMQIRFADDLETMHSRQMLARVFAGAGAALAATGGVLLLIGSGGAEHAPEAQARLSCMPAKCNATLTGRF